MIDERGRATGGAEGAGCGARALPDGFLKAARWDVRRSWYFPLTMPSSTQSRDAALARACH